MVLTAAKEIMDRKNAEFMHLVLVFMFPMGYRLVTR